MSEEKPLSFEQALERIEAIVHQLEEGQVGLEESLARYEQAVELLKHCYSVLQQAEKRVQLLVGLDSEGQPVTEPFDATATWDQKGGDGANNPAEETKSAANRGPRRSRATKSSVSTQPQASPEPSSEEDSDAPQLF